MKKELMWFECSRCNKAFRAKVAGHYLTECNHEADELCFRDAIYGDIHRNSFVNPLVGKRLCPICARGRDLSSYG